ncbi:MAG: DNA polymerase III subunit beta [Patescibacteria group bacterium]
MEINIVRENLLESLNFASKVQNVRSSIPILSNVLLKTEEGKIVIIATDMEQTIVSYCGVEIVKEGSITVNLKNLYDFLSNLKSEAINIKVEDFKLIISDLKNEISLNTIPSDEFPEFKDKKNDYFIKINALDFSNAADKVTFASSTDPTKTILNGILFETDISSKSTDKKSPNDKKKDSLKLIGINGFRFASYKIIGVEVKKETDRDIIIPTTSVDSISKIIKELNVDEETFLYISETENKNQLIFEILNVKFISRIIDGKYPDYKKIFPESFDNKFTINFEEFRDVVKLSNIFKFKDISRIYLDLNPLKDEIKIYSSLAEVGESVSFVSTKIKGEKGVICFNSKYLMDFLNHVEGNELQIQTNNPQKKKVSQFEDTSDPNFTYLMTPLQER